MIYLIIGICILFFTLLEMNNATKSKSAILSIIVSIIMILLAGLRNKVGTDWPAYFDFYKYGVENVEYGYALINNFFGKGLNLPYNLFLIFINSVAISLMFVASKRNSPLPVLALLLYFSDLYLYFNLSGIRQGLATAFTCFSIYYAYGDKRNFIKFFAFILLAMMFHITSIIFIAAYFIPKRPLKKIEYIILIMSLLSFSSVLFFITNYFTGGLAAKALFYLELQEQEGNIRSLFIVGIIRRSIPLFLILFFANKVYFKEKLRCFLFNLYLVGFCIYLSSYLLSPDIGVRLSSYFIVLEVFMLGHLVYVCFKKVKLVYLLIIIFTVVFYKISTYMAIPTYIYNFV